MDDFLMTTLTDRAADRLPTTETAPPTNRGLGPNQLNWLRSNINSFRYAENQQAFLQQDAVRAARIAGLI